MANLSVRRNGHILDPVLLGTYFDQTERPSQGVSLRFAAAVGEWLTVRQHGLVVTVNRLRGALNEALQDGDRPSMAAAEASANLLLTAYGRMSNFFPRGWVTVSPDGGLRVEWVKGGNRHVRLSVSGEVNNIHGYVYYEEGPIFRLEELSAEVLAARLDWLNA